MQLRKLVLQNIIWRGLYFFTVFFVNIFVARYLKADGSGSVYYVVNNLSFLLLIAGLSLESGATYFISKQIIPPQKVFLFFLIWPFIAALLIIFFFSFIFKTPGNILTTTAEFNYACFIYITGVLLTTYFGALFFSKQNFILPNIILLSVNLFTLVFFSYYSAQPIMHQHFVIIYFSSFFLQGFILAAAYFFQMKKWENIGSPSLALIKKLVRYSLLALAANVIFFLVYRVDYWFVNKFCSTKDLGNYIQVSKLVQAFLIFPSICASVIFPIIAAGKKNLSHSIQLLSSFMFIAFLLLNLIIVISGKTFFLMIFGNSFDEMYVPYLLLIPGNISLSLQALLGAFFAGENKIKINLWGAVVALLIIIVGDILLVPLYGIKAAAGVSSVAYTANLAFLIIIYCRDYQMKAIYFFIVRNNGWNVLKLFYKDFFSEIFWPTIRK
jgi:O-antigen/teichoic acid export membrane protein